MVTKVLSYGISGIDAYKVHVEVDTSGGLPAFEIVGLPDVAIRESKERVRSAYKNAGFKFPAQRITVNLAPASIRKEGSVFDLSILLGLLQSSRQFNFDLDFEKCAFAGELSLIGEVRPVAGILSMITTAKDDGIKDFYIPEANVPESEYIDGINIYPVNNIKQLLAHFTGEKPIDAVVTKKFDNNDTRSFTVDFSDVKGQYAAKRALEIAASGGHNILLLGHIVTVPKVA